MDKTAARGLQADLNQYAQALNFEGLAVDGKLGPKTLTALQAVVKAALAKSAPLTFKFPETVDDVGPLAPQIREWLHATAPKLSVSPFKVYQQGAGKDWNIKGEIAYGAGATHDEFVALQKSLNTVATAVGFKELDTDGFIGAKTAEAVKKTWDKVVAKNAALAVTPFPAPDTKEEAAQYAAFIRNWIDTTAKKNLLAEAGA